MSSPLDKMRQLPKNFGYLDTFKNPYRVTKGDHETAEVGNLGIAIAGHFGIAIAGDHGKAIVGVGGHAAAGRFGTIMIQHLDGATKTAHTRDESNVLPNVLYRLSENGEFVQDISKLNREKRKF